jgi:hypothetical protein
MRDAQGGGDGGMLRHVTHAGREGGMLGMRGTKGGREVP